jgi:hypothetical protein
MTVQPGDGGAHYDAILEKRAQPENWAQPEIWALSPVNPLRRSLALLRGSDHRPLLYEARSCSDSDIYSLEPGYAPQGMEAGGFLEKLNALRIGDFRLGTIDCVARQKA